jgi:hypothetical protein
VIRLTARHCGPASEESLRDPCAGLQPGSMLPTGSCQNIGSLCSGRVTVVSQMPACVTCIWTGPWGFLCTPSNNTCLFMPHLQEKTGLSAADLLLPENKAILVKVRVSGCCGSGCCGSLLADFSFGYHLDESLVGFPDQLRAASRCQPVCCAQAACIKSTSMRAFVTNMMPQSLLSPPI